MGKMGGGGVDPPKVVSDPPLTKLTVTNLYVDPVTGRLVVEYDDSPVGG